ncbi:GIY-YIG nuclease family protein [Patescibacteria group bacterium]|nr:GIY-YIG nuclease family protein [Patescibacteria group bacterium]
MYFAYILFSLKDKGIYTGYTSNIALRFRQHCNGLVKPTMDRRPLKLIYYEAYRYQKDALNREKYLKTGWGRYYLNKVIKNYLSHQ